MDMTSHDLDLARISAITLEVAKLRAAIAEHVPEIIERLKQQALDGDVQAARLLLERTIAPLKSVEPAQALALPDGTLTA